ncbi:MAG TPA: toll/interleukin-1 receptor domain-containing protein [Xanthobacteraceae bacterium]|nr:toll/interleukin-1 receptor domain-containing protein [Xanthobacteraceae bacterium]
MSQSIFVSYRRDDVDHFAGRLVDSISAKIPGVKVFMDVDSIRFGADFVEVLWEQLASCRAMILVIGPSWLAQDQGGKSRLDDPDDFVRLEIETAIKRNVPIVPVLVDGAAMPKENEIPASVRSIRRRHHVSIDHESYSAILPGLVSQLTDLVRPSSAGQGERKPAEATRTTTPDPAVGRSCASTSPARALGVGWMVAALVCANILSIMFFVSGLVASSTADRAMFMGRAALATLCAIVIWIWIWVLRYGMPRRDRGKPPSSV